MPKFNDPFDEFRKKKEVERITRMLRPKTGSSVRKDAPAAPEKIQPLPPVPEPEPEMEPEPPEDAIPEKKQDFKKVGFYDKPEPVVEKKKNAGKTVKPPGKRGQGKDSSTFGGYHISSFFKSRKKKR